MEDIYFDQAPYNSRFGDRVVNSFYTDHGIRCIDSQYCYLIQNIHQEVKGVYSIDRRREIITYKGKEYEGDYKEYYDPISLEGNEIGTCGVRVEWVDGTTKDFFYGERPVFDTNTRKSDKDQLIKEIDENVHLHSKIKENLISNILNSVK